MKFLLPKILTLLVALGSLAFAQETFTYAAQADAVGLSPVLTNDNVSAVANRHIYENLVRVNPETGELEPWLATSWETPDDNTWIFHLREGVTFHDGTPFNAQAVKFTFERIKDPEVGAPRASLMEPIESIEVIDDHTVKITTKEPYGAFLAALSHTNAAIVSPTAVKKYGDLMQNPVGTGPYMFEEWVSGDHITLVANPNYWNGTPEIERFVIRVIPDLNTQVALLESGEVDLIDALPPELVERLQNQEGIEVSSRPGTRVTYLGFNYQKPLWQNEKAREAIAAAINKDVIAQLLGPLAQKSCSIIGPQVFGYIEGVEEACTSFNPERAKELWQEVDARPVELWVPNTGIYPRVGQIVQGQLRQAGIEANINMVEWGAYLAATSDYQHDLYLLGWSNVTADGSELLYPNLHSDNIAGANRSAYENPEIEELIEQSRETTDQQARLEYLDQANRALLEDNAWVTLFHGNVIVAHRTPLTGLQVLPNGDWSIAKASFQ